MEVCYDDDDDGYDDNEDDDNSDDDERYPFSLYIFALDVLTLGKYGMSGV